jgi:Flp pilus assembly pilin Flp
MQTRVKAKQSNRFLWQLWESTHGQDLIEYALLIALISTTVLITVTQLGAKVPGMYSTTAEALPIEGRNPASPDNGDSGAPDGGKPGKGGNPGIGNPGNSKPVGKPGNNPGGGKGK